MVNRGNHSLFNRDSDSEKFGKTLIENRNLLKLVNERLSCQNIGLYLSAEENSVIVNKTNKINGKKYTEFMMMPNIIGARLKVKKDQLRDSDRHAILEALDFVVKAQKRKRRYPQSTKEPLLQQDNSGTSTSADRFEHHLSDNHQRKSKESRKSRSKKQWDMER